MRNSYAPAASCELIKMEKSEKIFYKDKYPDGYIEHYLAMYSTHREGVSDQDFETQNRLYIECEGKEEFQKLRDEVIEAKQQKDWQWFLRLSISREINNLDLNNLQKMFESIENFRT